MSSGYFFAKKDELKLIKRKKKLYLCTNDSMSTPFGNR